jgi:hypothetical protein
VTTREIPNGVAFELSAHIVGLERQTGRAVLVEHVTPGPGGQHRPLPQD